MTKRAAGLPSILLHSFFPTFNMAKDGTSLLDEHTMKTLVKLLKGNAATCIGEMVLKVRVGTI